MTDKEVTYLSYDDYMLLIDMLENPPEPNEALRELMSKGPSIFKPKKEQEK